MCIIVVKAHFMNLILFQTQKLKKKVVDHIYLDTKIVIQYKKRVKTFTQRKNSASSV